MKFHGQGHFVIAIGGMPLSTQPQDPMEQEQTRLIGVMQDIARQVERLERLQADADRSQAAADELQPQTADEVAQQTVARLRTEQLLDLRVAQAEPYFGRIDFAESGSSGNPAPLYIGKRGVEAQGSGDRLVIDWRAPVSRLFYASTGHEPSVSYTSPDGEVTGEVYLKRNIVIRDGVLQRAVDSFVRGEDNLSVTDEFLLYRLAEQKDNRLRDIVSTIQAEQDRIIRAPRSQALIIQGVAGSGKTTVALHRLAFLLYEYKERMRAERMIIFAPNSMFLDYISEVLPELGVGGIRQTTFAAWALEVLGSRLQLTNSEERFARWFERRPDHQYEVERQLSQRKGSLAFAADIDHHLQDLEGQMVPDSDFVPWEGIALAPSVVLGWWRSEYYHLPFGKRQERVLARVKRWYEMQLKQIESTQERTRVRKLATSRFRTYRHKWPTLEVEGLYRDILRLCGMPTVQENEAGAKRRAPAISRGAARKEVELADVAPLLYLHTQLHGVESSEQFDHVVIDEAQDCSPLQVALLKAYCPSRSLTVLGDLGQSIHTDQGITAWDAFLDLFEEEQRSYFQLDVSYRSTTEIIEFANAVITRFPGFVQARPVFRSGRAVHVRDVDVSERLQAVVIEVQGLQRDAHTVAVICRDAASCPAIFDALQAAGVEVQLIDAAEQHYRGGVSVLPVYLAKGLEFDAVLLVDVDARHYDDTPFSARLLYVGCTRALHQLCVHYSEEPSPLLPVSRAAGEREGLEIVRVVE